VVPASVLNDAACGSERLDYIGWIRQLVGHEEIILNFAAACVLDADGRRVLLQRRSDDGSWGFPGGAIELGESAADAAVRETSEETGLDVEITDLLGVYSNYRHRYPNGDRAQLITVFFVCCSSEEPGVGIDGGLSGETLELGLFELAAPPDPLVNTQHRDALDDLRAGRRGVYR
jgi:8-oxo-dGTP pyrophosphatase MutT (NUDIX family)